MHKLKKQCQFTIMQGENVAFQVRKFHSESTHILYHRYT